MDHLHQREPMAAGRAVGIGMWLGCWLVPFTDFDPRRPRLPWSYPLALLDPSDLAGGYASSGWSRLGYGWHGHGLVGGVGVGVAGWWL